MSAVASVLPFHWAKLQGDDGKKLEETGCFLLCLFCNLLIIKYYPPPYGKIPSFFQHGFVRCDFLIT